ncbi:unnamed protein product [Linum tenue]|uniref:GDSL esterase/lipase n=1 Tax=Linum tenue TaxID=586396 RepID=A0AAV0LRW5_9ROSI|nr:unnamed protein product [Linum tenue]
MVPAAFVFGDSVVDVGNNNHLLFSIAKSNYPHYGVDFAYGEPTGRFSNGKIPSDLVGTLPSPPPYLSIRHIWQNINKNVSELGFGFGFGSGSIPLTECGQRLYAYGARRFALTGLPALGCAPARRLPVKNQECDNELNSMCDTYNRMLKPMLQRFKSKHKGVSYTYFDAYTFFLDVVNNASRYGFSETKAACCGVGKLEAEFLCTPFSDYCEDRNKYMFFDRIHPTEAMYRHVVDAIIDGPSKYVAPMNIRKLVSEHAS